MWVEVNSTCPLCDRITMAVLLPVGLAMLYVSENRRLESFDNIFFAESLLREQEINLQVFCFDKLWYCTWEHINGVLSFLTQSMVSLDYESSAIELFSSCVEQ